MLILNLNGIPIALQAKTSGGNEWSLGANALEVEKEKQEKIAELVNESQELVEPVTYLTKDTQNEDEFMKSQQAAEYIQELNSKKITFGNRLDDYTSSNSLLTEAKILLRAGKYPFAENLLRILVKSDPNNTDVKKNLALSLFHQKNFPAAEQEYNEVLDLTKNRDAEAKTMLGLQIFMKKFNNKDEILDKVDQLYVESINLKSDYGLPHYFLAANCCWRFNQDNNDSHLDNALNQLENAFQKDKELVSLFKKMDTKQGRPFEILVNQKSGEIKQLLKKHNF